MSINASGWRRAGHLAMAAALIAASLVFDLEPLAIIALVFVLVVPFGKLFPRHRGQRLRREGVGTDLAFALCQPLLGVITVIVAFPIAVVSLAWLPGLAVRPLVAAIPPPLMPFVFLLAAGFTTEFTGIVAIVQILTGLFLHANVRWRWRPLHKVLITPEFHHWHHANEPDAYFSNYATFLPVWDLLFGTYFMPRNRRRPAVYGVTEPIPREPRPSSVIRSAARAIR